MKKVNFTQFFAKNLAKSISRQITVNNWAVRKIPDILEEEKLRAECEAQGKDFEREKLKHISLDDAEASERRKRAKQNPDKGFSTYEAAAFRKYNQQVKSIQPNLEKYENFSRDNLL